MSSAMAAAKANCPSCVGGKIESIPIAENEEYKFDYDTERGLNSSDENRGSFVVTRYLSNQLSFNINKDQKTQLPIGQGNR
jgi:hypothetical protein